MRGEVRINGQRVDLANGWDLELVNAAADYESVIGNRGMQIGLANTPANKRLLGWINEPSTDVAPAVLEADVYLAGNMVDRGYCYGRGGGVVDYTSRLNELYGKYQGVKLNEIDLGTIAMPVWNNTVSNSWLNGGFVLPTVDDEVFFKDETEPVGWNGKINGYTSGYGSTTKVPMFFMKAILKMMGDLAGVSYVGEVWNELNSVVVFSNKAAEDPIIVRQHLPSLTVVELLMALRKWLNVAIYVDTRSKTVRLSYADKSRRTKPVFNWTALLPILNTGAAVRTDGLVLEYVADSADELAKDEFFKAKSGIDTGLGFKKVSTAVMPLLMVGSNVSAKVVGTAKVGSNKASNSVRVLAWNGSATNANNTLLGNVMSQAGLYDKHWKRTNEVEMHSYVVTTEAALTAKEVSWLAAIWRGELDEPSVVYAHGQNWEVLRCVVPVNKAGGCSLTLRRL